MAPKNPAVKLSAYRKKLESRILDLILGRLLKRVYLSFDEPTRNKMGEVFASGLDKEKEDFIKEHIPTFKELFDEELKSIEEKIIADIENSARPA